ncbi:MAG: benzaldehyde dehydrogenase [Micromonosporaceae bacterium]|nr:benzaldehyde dehydrogenase [Micromonosporaceae bacterium]
MHNGTLLDSAVWQGQIYSGGWVSAYGGEVAIAEPATGGELGRTGSANAEDVERAAKSAAAAQKAWAATNFEERAAVLRRAGDLKRVHLELGGNSAIVILEDADLERAVSAGAWASFLHQGQICMTAGRHIVHEAIADDYLSALVQHADHLPVGDPASGQVALGPLIDAGQRDRVHDLVTSTVDAGARLAAGGTYEGLFYRPTVLDNVRSGMPAYAEEVFGPVAPVIRFSSVEEAVSLAADSTYGLSLGIFTKDVMKGLALAEQIPTGIVHINDQTVNDGAVAPFGGVLDSGTGARFGGTANLDAFTEQRWITVRGDIPAYPF